MCLRPRHITVFYNRTKLHKQLSYSRVISKWCDGELANRIDHRFSQLIKVPCGHCPECMRARQNDLAARVALAAREYHNMHFVTLTYRDFDIPLSARPALVDTDTGEIILDSVPINLTRQSRSVKVPFDLYQQAYFRSELEKLPATPKARVIFHPGEDCVNRRYLKYYFITPTLNRRDVRMWLKRCRVRFERAFGHKCSDFKYVLAGEFGSKTCRPHYHLILLGLKPWEVRFFVSQWSFGFAQMKTIPEINKDGSSGFVCASKYISKYIVKGDFEVDSVIKGYVERPRVCLSRYVGTRLPDEYIDYFRCTDVYGRYGLDSLIVDNGTYFGRQLNIDELRNLYNEFRKRSVLRFGLSSWLPLPRAVIKQLFSVNETYYSIDKNENIEFTRQSVVQMAFNSFVESDLLGDFVAKLRQDCPQLSDGEIQARIDEFLVNEKNVTESKESSGKLDFQRFYAQDSF